MRATGGGFSLRALFDPIVSCPIGFDLRDRRLRAVGLAMCGCDRRCDALYALPLPYPLKLITTGDVRPVWL